jgi:hypothetical protein
MDDSAVTECAGLGQPRWCGRLVRAVIVQLPGRRTGLYESSWNLDVMPDRPVGLPDILDVAPSCTTSTYSSGLVEIAIGGPATFGTWQPIVDTSLNYSGTAPPSVIHLLTNFKVDWSQTSLSLRSEFMFQSPTRPTGGGILEQLFPELADVSDEDIDDAIRYARGKLG